MALCFSSRTLFSFTLLNAGFTVQILITYQSRRMAQSLSSKPSTKFSLSLYKKRSTTPSLRYQNKFEY